MRRMTLIFSVLLSSPLLPAQDAKPVSFGNTGYVTNDQLAKLTYGPVVKDLALGMHVPNPRVRAGEPLWAYFVIKNLGDTTQGLDMRFDFVIGRTHRVVNSWSFTVKPLTAGAKLGSRIHERLWECGSGSLIDVAGKGYHVAALDLMAWGQLKAGDYEVSWRYTGEHVSNTVRFSVLAADDGIRAVTKARRWTAWELGSSRAKQDMQKEEWDPTFMRAWFPGDLAAALGSGVGDRHVTNLETLPARDGLLSVSADWKFGDKEDRVTLRLTAKDPKVRVSLDRFHLYLLADGPQGRVGEGMADRVWDFQRVAPHTIELHLPSHWRAKPKEGQEADPFQAAILLTSRPLREPQRGRALMRELTLHTRAWSKNPPRIWEGLLRTGFQTIAWR